MLTQKWRVKLAKQLQVQKIPRLHRAYKIATTFGLVCFAYIFFQARNLADAWYLVSHLLHGWSSAPASLSQVLQGEGMQLLLGLTGAFVLQWVDFVGKTGGLKELVAPRPAWVRFAAFQACAVAIVLFGAFYGQGQAFIYFQF
jgi:hypothetical protein